jgi:hypothetical protein
MYEDSAILTVIYQMARASQPKSHFNKKAGWWIDNNIICHFFANTNPIGVEITSILLELEKMILIITTTFLLVVLIVR